MIILIASKQFFSASLLDCWGQGCVCVRVFFFSSMVD